MKLNTKRTLFAGFAFLLISAFWQLYDGLIPQILKNSFDINDVFSGFIMSFDNILSLFLLPIFGALSDKTNTRLGKRTPYILFGTIAAVIIMMILPIAESTRNLSLFLIALFLLLLAMATFRSPAVALMPDITPKPFRSKANAIINLMGTIGGIVILLSVNFLVPAVDHPDYMPVFAFTAVLMFISLVILLKTTKENKLRKIAEEETAALGLVEEEEKEETAAVEMSKQKKRSLYFILASVFFWFMGYNGITTAFSKYASVYWGFKGGSFASTLILAQAAAIVCFVPVGILSGKIGRKKTILLGIILLFTAFFAGSFFKTYSFWITIFFIIAGAGWAAINVNSYPMVVELAKGSNIGKYTGYYYTASQAAQVLTPILSGFILEYGYLILGSTDPNAGYAFLFPYGAFFVALSFLTMRMVKHGDTKPQEKAKILDQFASED
ncbi:MAG: SLC45 family MFS transporter [Clostridiales bacterium]|nr:SLC45 family MFS transporter [Clostridiales bacterium]